MLTSTMNPSIKKDEKAFPKLMQYKPDDNLVILASKKNGNNIIGVVVKGVSPFSLGTYLMDWSPDLFCDFIGAVTLTQE